MVFDKYAKKFQKLPFWLWRILSLCFSWVLVVVEEIYWSYEKLKATFKLVKILQKESKTILTATLSAEPQCDHMAFKSILRETQFLDQLHDFSLLSLKSFSHPFMKSKFMTKILLRQKKFIFEGRISKNNIPPYQGPIISVYNI